MYTITLNYPRDNKEYVVEIHDSHFNIIMSTKKFDTYIVAQNYCDGVALGFELGGINFKRKTKAFYKKDI